MDKLELDARVAKLERQVSLLMTLMVSFLALLVVPVLLMIFWASSSRPAVMTIPPPMIATLPPVPPPIGSLAWSKGTGAR
jgi:hypothetical protein